MHDLSSSLISIDLFAESVCNKTMNLRIQVNDEMHNVDLVSDRVVTWAAQIQLPTRLLFLCTGRDAESTVVDSSGAILKNRIIKIESIRLDGLVIEQDYIENFLVTTPADSNESPVTGSVLCINGIAAIEFQGQDALTCSLLSKLR